MLYYDYISRLIRSLCGRSHHRRLNPPIPPLGKEVPSLFPEALRRYQRQMEQVTRQRVRVP